LLHGARARRANCRACRSSPHAHSPLGVFTTQIEGWFLRGDCRRPPLLLLSACLMLYREQNTFADLGEGGFMGQGRFGPALRQSAFLGLPHAALLPWETSRFSRWGLLHGARARRALEGQPELVRRCSLPGGFGTFRIPACWLILSIMHTSPCITAGPTKSPWEESALGSKWVKSITSKCPNTSPVGWQLLP